MKEDFKLLKVKIKFITQPFSPLEADMFWGKLMWVARLLDLCKELDFKNTPSLIISDPFPAGFLPRPLSFYIPFSKLTTLGSKFKKTIASLITKSRFLPFDEVKELANGKTDIFKMIEERNERKRCPVAGFTLTQLPKQLKTCLNNCTTGAGKECREVIKTFLNSAYDIYVFTSWQIERIKRLFYFLGKFGYGKRCSAGAGLFKVQRIEVLPRDLFSTDSMQSFCNLSTGYVPMEGEEFREIYGDIYYKWGKLGKWKDRHILPFKYPIAKYRAGSVFMEVNSVKEFYGQLISGIHPEREEVLEYCFAFPLWGRFKNERNSC